MNLILTLSCLFLGLGWAYNAQSLRKRLKIAEDDHKRLQDRLGITKEDPYGIKYVVRFNDATEGLATAKDTIRALKEQIAILEWDGIEAEAYEEKTKGLEVEKVLGDFFAQEETPEARFERLKGHPYAEEDKG